MRNSADRFHFESFSTNSVNVTKDEEVHAPLCTRHSLIALTFLCMRVERAIFSFEEELDFSDTLSHMQPVYLLFISAYLSGYPLHSALTSIKVKSPPPFSANFLIPHDLQNGDDLYVSVS